jgi:hypothetical protein
METSAKTNTNIHEVFETIGVLLLLLLLFVVAVFK